MAHRGRQNADDALAIALASGQSVRDAAAHAGVGERTATRRMADAGFRQKVAELREAMLTQALGKMVNAMADAATTLHKLLKAKSESVRLGAARSMLELTVKLKENLELEPRVRTLEAQAKKEKLWHSTRV